MVSKSVHLNVSVGLQRAVRRSSELAAARWLEVPENSAQLVYMWHGKKVRVIRMPYRVSQNTSRAFAIACEHQASRCI